MGKYDQVLKNTENIIQLLQDKRDWTIIIPIIVALIALFGAIFSVVYVKNNIKMQARIEWIQRVRETAAEAMSLCYSLVYEIEEDKAKDILLKAQEKINLLILYFGPDENKKEMKKKDRDILMDEKSNEGKNSEMVKELKNIIKRIKDYYERKYSSRVQMLIIQIRDLNNNYPLEQTSERYMDEDDEWQYVKARPKKYFEEKEKLEKEKEKLQNPDEIIHIVEKLMEDFRIYIKVEWNVVKKGK